MTEVQLPSARLATVTRKKHEIEQLLNNAGEIDSAIVTKLNGEFLEELDAFLQACKAGKLATSTEGRVKLDKWFAEHNMAIVSFRIIVEDFECYTNVGDAHNKNSDLLTKKSWSTSALAAIFRLAKKTAKAKAEKLYNEKLKSQTRKVKAAVSGGRTWNKKKSQKEEQHLQDQLNKLHSKGSGMFEKTMATLMKIYDPNPFFPR